MEISFHKMHGTLNDFVVFHDLSGAVTLAPDQIRRICNRRSGVGGDGVIVVRKSDTADFFMDYVNADGSLAEMCGNGIRCLAKYVYDSGLTTKKTLAVETRAGVKKLKLIAGRDGKIARVQVDMGAPLFDPAAIPTTVQTNTLPIVDYPIEIQGRTFLATILSMGNPHCVIPADGDLDECPKQFGPIIEHHPLFPARTNVEFIRVPNRERIVMRVWERGSGETFACGTGACAAMVAAVLKGLVDSSATVELLGGELQLEWQDFKSSVIMTGESVLVYEGTLTI
jgi:diaminopimelate epimerase